MRMGRRVCVVGGSGGGGGGTTDDTEAHTHPRRRRQRRARHHVTAVVVVVVVVVVVYECLCIDSACVTASNGLFLLFCQKKIYKTIFNVFCQLDDWVKTAARACDLCVASTTFMYEPIEERRMNMRMQSIIGREGMGTPYFTRPTYSRAELRRC